MVEVTVTRNGQITLSKELREELGIHEGDTIVLNLLEDRVILSKKDPSVWDKLGDFLPEDFEATLGKIRTESDKRFKKLGIVQ